MILMERVARNVKRRRTALGLTQQTLAERAGITRIYVAVIESGRKEISLDMLGRLAKALWTKPGRLLD